MKNADITPELIRAVERTLYHHQDVTPVMVKMIIGKEFVQAPPLPSEEEKKQAADIVNNLLKLYKRTFEQVVFEVIEEKID